jgi:hypothetical protein
LQAKIRADNREIPGVRLSKWNLAKSIIVGTFLLPWIKNSTQRER